MSFLSPLSPPLSLSALFLLISAPSRTGGRERRSRAGLGGVAGRAGRGYDYTVWPGILSNDGATTGFALPPGQTLVVTVVPLRGPVAFEAGRSAPQNPPAPSPAAPTESGVERRRMGRARNSEDAGGARSRERTPVRTHGAALSSKGAGRARSSERTLARARLQARGVARARRRARKASTSVPP